MPKKIQTDNKSADKAPRRVELRIALLLGLILLLCYSYYFYMGGNWNIETRLALTHAIVDDGTLMIDRYEARTGDKAFYKGHYYCDKAVGASFLGVPVYWAVRPLLARYGATGTWVAGNYIISFFTTAIPSAMLGVLFYLLLGAFVAAAKPRIWLTLAYGLGTIAFPYATMFFGHQTAAAFAFIAFYLLFRARHRKWSGGGVFFAGLLAGYALITDYLSVAVILGLVVYAVVTVLQVKLPASPNKLAGRTSKPPAGSKPVGGGAIPPAGFRPPAGFKPAGGSRMIISLWPFFIGIILPLPLQLWYNWACFDNAFASAYKYEALPQFARGMSVGLMGITFPKLEALYQLTFGPRRGLFYGSPFLLFALPGAWLLMRRLKSKAARSATRALSEISKFRLEGSICAGVGIFTLLLNSGYYLWWGGEIYGPRFLLPALPFIALLALPALYRAPKAFKLLAVTSIVFTSVVVITIPFISEASPNPLFDGAFRSLIRNGLDLRPNFTFNAMSLFGLDDIRSVLPLAAIIAICLKYLASLKAP